MTSHAIYPAFRALDLERKFSRDGYLVLPLLDAPAVADLAALAAQPAADLPPEFHLSGWSTDRAYRQRTGDAIRRAFAPRLDELMADHRFLMANFIVKGASAENYRVELHQDATVVDEPWYRAVHVWCPLVDVDPSYGCMSVIPGSHGWNCWQGRRRPAGEDAELFILREILPELRESYEVPLQLKAGEALFYDGRLVHASPRNERGAARPVAFSLMAPCEAQLLLFHRTAPGELEEFAVADEFYDRDFLPRRRPEGLTCRARLQQDNRAVRLEDLPPPAPLPTAHYLACAGS